MIDWLHSVMMELGIELRRIYTSWPDKSVEYTILMQDLSKQPGQSRPLLHGNVRPMSADLRQVYQAISLARREYQELYVILYMRSWSRKRKIDHLGLKNHNELYTRRDELHSYIQAILDMSRKSVMTDLLEKGPVVI